MTETSLPFAITLDPGTSLANLTGSWRSSRPNYVDRLPPCNNAGPDRGKPAAGGHGPGLLPPLRGRL